MTTSFVVPRQLLPELPALKQSQLSVYVALCGISDESTGFVQASVTTLARITGISRRRVYSALQHLRSSGFIRTAGTSRSGVLQHEIIGVSQPAPEPEPVPVDGPRASWCRAGTGCTR